MDYEVKYVYCHFFVSFNFSIFRERELSLGLFISFNKCFIGGITIFCFIYHQVYTVFRLDSFPIITKFVKRAGDIVDCIDVVK